MLLFSDGVDRGSKTSLDRAIETTQRADALVYCVYVASEREEQTGQGGGGRRAGGGYPAVWISGGGGPFPGGGGGYPAAADGAGQAALRSMRTKAKERKFCNGLRERRAEDILSFQKN